MAMTLFSLGQDTLYYNQVIDWDGIKRRTLPDKGMWVCGDSTLVKWEDGFDIPKNVVEKRNHRYYCINDFGEAVEYTIMPTGDLVARNQARQEEYTIYRLVDKKTAKK
jgi:hypothetical protein